MPNGLGDEKIVRRSSSLMVPSLNHVFPNTASIGELLFKYLVASAHRPSIGGALRVARVQQGWPQAQLRLDLPTLGRLAEVWGIALQRLGIASGARSEADNESGEDVLRRQFLTAAGLTVPAWLLARVNDALAMMPTR